MPLGPRSTKSLTLLTGWDAAELEKYELQDGTSYLAIAQQINTALGALNAEIASDPLISSLVSYTDIPTVEYRMGVSNGFEPHTEYGRPDAKKAQVEGHMLPLRPWDRMLSWTWDFLRNAMTNRVQADIADAIKDGRDLIRIQLLTRALKRTDDAGVALGLGTGGYSPGFATTAASTNVDFTPVTYGGTVFTNTHEHYVGITGGAFTLVAFQDAKDELREHGHEPPYDMIVGPTSEAAIRLLTGFVPAPSFGVLYGNSTNLAMVDSMADGNGSYTIGVLEDFRIRIVRGIPQYYGLAYKSYGPNSQRNPLRIRVPKGQNSIQFVAMPDPKAGTGLTPLQNLMLFSEFGVGVGDRTAATPRYVNNATWADGTPT